MRYASWLLFIFLAACSGQKQSAQKLMADIHAVVTAASSEAAKYVPSQLAEVQSKVIELQVAFDKQDYATVVGQAPQVLESAQGLATEAAAKKDEILKQLNDEWTSLAATLPGQMDQLAERLESLSRKAKRPPAGVDLDGAKQALSAAQSLWSKAQGAFGAGNLDEAVRSAQEVKAQIQTAAKSVKLDLPG